jgi:hypothetical protein
MSKRLQVLLEESELRELQETARREGMPLSEWVRRALRDAQASEPEGDIERKLRVVRAATKYNLPTADIDQMLVEIERGYSAPGPE